MNVYFVNCDYYDKGLNIHFRYQNIIFANNKSEAEKMVEEHMSKFDCDIINLEIEKALGHSTILGNVCK